MRLFAIETNNPIWEARALNAQGTSHKKRSDLLPALDYYQQCMEIQVEIGDQRGVGTAYNNIGLIQARVGQHPTGAQLSFEGACSAH
jgi:hypothetical protein